MSISTQNKMLASKSSSLWEPLMSVSVDWPAKRDPDYLHSLFKHRPGGSEGAESTVVPFAAPPSKLRALQNILTLLSANESRRRCHGALEEGREELEYMAPVNYDYFFLDAASDDSGIASVKRHQPPARHNDAAAAIEPELACHYHNNPAHSDCHNLQENKKPRRISINKDDDDETTKQLLTRTSIGHEPVAALAEPPKQQPEHEGPPSAARMDLRLVVLSLCIILNESLALSTYLVDSVPTFVASLIIALASFGASFGLRKMYVRALLKIFEYATNIKQEKTKECEQLLEDDVNKNEFKRRKELARLNRLRKESFMLRPNDSSARLARIAANDDDDESDLDDIDKQNNNYLASDADKPVSSRVRTKSTSDDIENDGSESKRTAGKEARSPGAKSRLVDAARNGSARLRSMSDIRKDFQLGDIIDFVHKGVECIIDDDVTKRFTTEELTVWNLLSRTNQMYEYVSFRVTVLWLVGLVLRYGILFPFRLILFIIACSYTFFSTLLIGFIKDGPFKRWLNWYASLILHRILSRVFSAIITFHNRENRAKSGSICVANHTSPIDVIILSTDNCYAMIGQTHGGFTGMMQSAFSRAGRHIWFDRSEAKDRSLVAKRMRDHVQDETSLPILIFPEGTCINNTSVMMFKKGCFEVDTTIYPVAIKYDLRFGDAFWNSSQHTMLQYLILMMTSWAIVVDVYYLPPMQKLPGEDATQFASRVKTEIVKKGSFVDLNWDGMLKRSAPKLDLMYEQQQKYVSQLKID